MSICDGAGIAALISSVKYVAKKPERGQQKLEPPAMLRKAMFFLGSMLAITYISTAADSWLHASSTSVSIPSIKPFDRAGVKTNFGREINQTTCEIAATPADQFSVVKLAAATCGLLNDGAHQLTAELAEGIRVIDNSSTINQMVLTNDQTAIVVPLNIPQSVSYKAKTLGVKAQCARYVTFMPLSYFSRRFLFDRCLSVTKQCLNPKVVGGNLDYGPDAVLNLDCVHGGLNYVNSTTLMSACPLSNKGLCVNWQNIPSK